jgi:hypothetical protein
VFYGWFVVGAFAINLSKYGLAGVEAGMLMNTRWGATNAMQLMRHCDKVTQNGPWLAQIVPK